MRSTIEVKWVDTNEQNTHAVGFISTMGVHVVNRSEFDETGNPLSCIWI